MERPPGSNRRMAPNRQRTVVQRAAPNLQTTQPTNQAGTHAVRHANKQTNNMQQHHLNQSCSFAFLLLLFLLLLLLLLLLLFLLLLLLLLFFFFLLLLLVVVVVNFEACKRPQTESSAHGCRSMPLKAANPPTQTCPGQA